MKKYLILLIVLLSNIEFIYSQVHYQVIYEGNGLDHMNFYVTSAATTINGSNLEIGDEIAVYDGVYCVGVSTYSGTATISIKASKDDEDDGINGFIAGNTYSLKVWDASEDIEMTNVIFSEYYNKTLFVASGSAYINSLTGCTTPSAPTVTLAQPACGSSTGTIAITAPTGSGISYSIDGSNYTNTSGSFINVANGTYAVTARRAGGCISSGTSVTIINNSSPSAPTVSVTQPVCGSTTGTVTISAPKSTGMTYSIDGSNYSNTSGVFSNVAVGSYTVTAKSSTGCISSGTTATVNANPLPSAPTVALDQPTCGASSGTITISAPTGLGMTYSINGSTYTNTSGVFSGVTAGTYNVTAKNLNGCVSLGTTATINVNPLPATPAISVIQPACGSATGAINVSAPTGAGMTYSINGSDYSNNTGSFTGVAIGSYTVTAKNSNGCVSLGTSATISANPVPSTPTLSLTQPVCGSSSGTITILTPTGTGLTYSIDGSTYTNTSGIFSGIAAGAYNVTVRNSNGCISLGASATIVANPLPSTPAISVTQPACGALTGVISISSPTGSGLTYSIDGSDYSNTSGVFSAVAIGSHNVTVKNSNGCVSLVTNASVNANPLPATPAISVVQPACGSATGAINISTPTGAGMTYSIDGLTYTNTNGIFTGILAGNYTVTAKNSTGCISTGSNANIIANPLPSTPTVSVTQPICGSSTGTINVTAPSGSGMTYSIDGTTYTNTSGSFTGITIGSYFVTAKNSNGCISLAAGAVITANPLPLTPTVAVTQPACGTSIGTISVTAPKGTGMTYSIDGLDYTNSTGIFSGITVGNYTVTAKNSNGCISSGSNVTINSNPLPSTPAVTVTQPACGLSFGTITISAPKELGMTYCIDGSTYTNTTGIFAGIAIGNYTVTAKNINGCISAGASATIAVNPLPSTPTVSVTQPECGSPNGIIEVTSPTGTGITYSIDGLSYTNTTGVFPGIAVGTYAVTAKNSVGCVSSSVSAVINANPLPSAPVLTVAQPACGSSTGTITVNSPSGSGMTYSIDGSTFTNTLGSFTGVAIGSYGVKVKNSNGCISSVTNAVIGSNLIPEAPTISFTQPTCLIATGSITISAPMGTDITYSINGSDYTNTTGLFTGVVLGSYSVKAKSQTGCVSPGTDVIIAANPGPSAPTISVSQPLCGSPTGVINISAPTGSGIMYSINGSDYSNTTGNFAAVAIGTYPVTVKNSDGCISPATNASINANPIPSTPALSVIQPLCGSANGTITVNTPTGMGMTYSIDGTDFSNTSGSFTGVAIGTYSITAKSTGGCVSSGASATINSNPLPSAPALTVEQPACGLLTGNITVSAPSGNGITYSIDGLNFTNTTGIFSAVASGNYAVTAKNSGGCISPETRVTITANPLPLAPTLTVGQPACGSSSGEITITAPLGAGLTYSIDGSDYSNNTGIFTEVVSGSYTVTSKNLNGCISSGTNAMIKANPIPSTPRVSVTQPLGGSTKGAITITDPAGSGITFSIDGLNYSNTTGIFPEVAIGTYTVTAKSPEGCISLGTDATISANTLVSPPAVTLVQPTCSIATGTINITAPMGTGMTYSIDGSNYSNITGIFTGVASGTYTVTAKSSEGFISSGTNVTINVQPKTPNQPGIITGEVTVCEHSSQSYSISEVPDATSYTWSLPSGWSGSSSTTTITAIPGATSGNISVAATNSCGSGTASILNISVTPAPTTPMITLNGRVLHSNATNGNQWYNSTSIDGATNQDYTATTNGDYFVIVTLNGCSSYPSNIIKLVLTGIEQTISDKTINLFPNPVFNELHIEIPDNTKKTNFEIINSSGKIVFTGNLIEKTVVNTTNYSSGIYFVRFNANGTYIIKKVVKE